MAGSKRNAGPYQEDESIEDSSDTPPNHNYKRQKTTLDSYLVKKKKGGVSEAELMAGRESELLVDFTNSQESGNERSNQLEDLLNDLQNPNRARSGGAQETHMRIA